MSHALGFALAASSALLNGSFVVFARLPSVRTANVDPLVFQMYTSAGVFLSSLLCIPFVTGAAYPAASVGWGLLAGGLFVCAVAFSFVAVQLIGMALAQGIWSGVAVLVAFSWGVGALGAEVTAGVAVAGCGLIVLGTAGIAACSHIAARIEACWPSSAADGAMADDSPQGGNSLSAALLVSPEPDGALTPALLSPQHYAHRGHHRGRAGSSGSHSAGGSVDLDPGLVHPATLRASNAAAGVGASSRAAALLTQQEAASASWMTHSAAAAAAEQRTSTELSPSSPHAVRAPSAFHAHAPSGGLVVDPAMSWIRTQSGGGGSVQGSPVSGGGFGVRRGSGPSPSARSLSPAYSPRTYSPSPRVGVDSESEHSLQARRVLQQQRQFYGVLCALIVGVFGGSILLPLQLAPKSVQGLSFVPSFGLGTLLIAPIITLPYMWLSRSSGSRGTWAIREALLPGLAAGAVWNGANICAIEAISHLGYAMAYSLMQCAIVVAALWGVLAFRELKGRQVLVLATSGVVVLGGAALLALSKH